METTHTHTALRIEVAGTFTTEPVQDVIDFWLGVLDLNAEVTFAPYNQVFQTLLKPNGNFAANKDGLNIVLARAEDWQRFSDDQATWEAEIRRNADDFIQAAESAKNAGVRFLVYLCPPSPDRPVSPFLHTMHEQIADACKQRDIDVVRSAELLDLYPVEEIHDAATDTDGHVPFTESFYAALGTSIVRKLRQQVSPPVKVLALDCDNTLWKGVCGESQIDDLLIDGPFQELQHFAKAQKEKGVLLCICSKNSEDDVHQVFANHPDMILTAEDISAWKANWDPKSQNLKALASELSLGLDSFVFIDDNPVEIAEVNTACPEVATLELPEDPNTFATFLKHAWVLDTPNRSLTDEDAKRSEMYRQNAERTALQETSSTFEDFIASLDLKIDIVPAEVSDIPRLAQLTQRTNQFNASTIRRSEAEMQELIASDSSKVLAVRVEDRFGAYGLVGLAIYEINYGALSINTLLLSCRVLGKSVEQKLMVHLALAAKDANAKWVDLIYYATKRNEPVKNFLFSIGEDHHRECEGGYIFSFPVDSLTALENQPVSDWNTSHESHEPALAAASSGAPLINASLFSGIAKDFTSANTILTASEAQRRPRPSIAEAYAAPRKESQKQIAKLWRQVLKLEQVGINDRFSDLGGKSVQVLQLLAKMRKQLGAELSITDLFENSTIAKQARLFDGSEKPDQSAKPETVRHKIDPQEDLAVVGMSVRVPEAQTVDAFWQNLVEGKECLTSFSDEELRSAGVDVASVRSDDSYLPVKGIMPDVECFDAAFFGILPKDAKLMDPQQRIFLELTWETLEHAGYNADHYPGRIGVWAGSYLDTYMIANLVTDRQFLKDWIPSIQVGSLQAELGNDKDYLATRVAYKLNLRGPAMTVQTACSTSLVAISQACQSLRSGECDMALAGGITITLPEKKGYYYTPDGMLSGDGSVRAFDEKASGTVFGNGAGVVLIKRLSDAIRDGDHIHSVIKGSAINNDGGTKHSYTAPSVDGQASVIQSALDNANVDAQSIGYVEAHGTGTPLGDPIEIAGLTKAFRNHGATGNQFCAVGTVKANVGHLDVASGVTALIKTSLAIEKGQIPPTLHYKNPNPKIDFDNSPFYVNAELSEWNQDTRRAGISSFGVGGTNAHVILEQPPVPVSSSSRRRYHLLPISARSEPALKQMHKNLVDFTSTENDLNLADAAYTLKVGRKDFIYRRIVVSDTLDLASAETAKAITRQTDAPVVFMFPGQGSQTINMGRDLYETEPFFRETVDRCAEILLPHLGEDIRSILFPGPEDDAEAAADRIKQTVMAQPAIFVISYAQALLLMHWGIKPEAMIGHSVGELVAATLAEVVSLEDALEILANRGKLMQDIPGGCMLSVRLSEEETLPYLNDKVNLAAVNGPELCVIAGPNDAVQSVENELEGKDIVVKRLHTSHGFHSWMMDPVIEPFAEVIAQKKLSPPKIPIRSTVTTEWLTDEEACDPQYWAAHVRKTVRFTGAVSHFWQQPESTLIEIGPGQTLSTLARQNPDKTQKQVILATSGHVTQAGSDAAFFQMALGRLWLAGHTVDWSTYHEGEDRLRVALPTYPFERKRFWIDPMPLDHVPGIMASTPNMETQPATNISQLTNETHTTEMSSTAETGNRKPAIEAKLQEMLSDLSGMEPEEMEPEASFLELGFDSLMLTQVSKEFQKEFGVPVTMRQLLDGLPSIEKMTEHLDKEMEPDAYRSVAPAPVQETPVSTATEQAIAPTMPIPQTPMVSGGMPATAGDGSLMDRVFAMQMQVMQQQLQLLGGGSVPGAQMPSLPNGGSTVANTASSALEATPAQKTPAATAPKTPQADAAPKGFSGPATAINRNLDESLSEQQQQHIEMLMERYITRTKGSKEWTAKYRQWYADPRTVSGFNRLWKEMIYQIVVMKSKGARLLDVDGNEYIDCLNGFGPGFFGHSPDFVVKAVETQLAKGFEVGPQMPLAGKTAKLFCEITGNERASFVNTGSEAVQAAMRLARTVTGRDKIAVFTKDYHGNFDEVLVRGIMSKGQPRTMPSAPGIPRRAVEDMLVLDYGTDESLDILKAHANELAAIMIEPVQSRRPEFRPRDFIHALRKITEESGSLLIFDEVITGFRDGPKGAQAYFGVDADLATYGKVVGAGMPIGVVAGKSEYMDTFDGGMWQYGDDSFPEAGVTFFAGTFVRHPLAIAAAFAALRHLEEQGPKLWDELNAKARRLYETVDKFMVENNAPIRVPGFNSRFFVRVAEDSKYGNLLFFHLRSKGVFILEGFPSYVTTAHTDEDIDYLIDAFKESVRELQAGGLFPTDQSSTSLNGHRLNGPKAKLASSDPEPLQVTYGEGTVAPQRTPISQNDDNLPLTEAQREIWLACNLGHEASCAFNEATSLVFEGDLDADALSKSLSYVVRIHDALRANFQQDGSSWKVVTSMDVHLPYEDISSRSPEDKENLIHMELETQAITPFDLEKGPLIRAKLLKLGQNQHVLFVTAHHIVCDGWSFNVVVENLSECYNALVAAKPMPNKQPNRFADYVIERNKREIDPELSSNEQYWLNLYKEQVPVIDLPTDRPFPQMRTFNGATAEGHIDTALLKDLRKAGAKHGCTLYSTMLTAFQIMLHRITGQDAMVIGIPAAGQSSEGLEDVVGHCVNFLPLRAELLPKQNFGELVKEVKQQMLDAYEHQDCTFGQLLPKLNVKRHPGRVPLVEVGFNLERMDYFKPFEGLETEFIDSPKRFVNQLLFLNIVESAKGMELECHFNTDVLNQSTVDRWLSSYKSLLESIVSDPDKPIGGLSFLDESGQQKAISLWTDTQSDYPRDVPVHQLFEQIAGEYPSKTAVIFEGQEMDYGTLNARANQLARKLRNAGVRRNMPIGVFADRSFELIVGLLGILKAGGGYVPIDPDYPQDRVDFLIQDTESPVILVDENLMDRLPANIGAQVISVNEIINNESQEDDSNLSTDCGADDLAYIIYTSGSTGNPKGVRVPQRGIVRLVRNTNYVDLDEHQVFLQAASLSFDASTFEIWGPLLNGGRLVLMPPGTPMLESIGRHIREHDVTTLWLTSGLFQLMVDERIDDLKPLKQLLAGGDVLSRSHVKKAFISLPNCRIINGYGPTENTTFTCCHTVVPEDLSADSIPIGKAISNTEVYVLGRNLEPLPAETEGELFIGGDGLAMGYHNNTALTEEKFIRNPFSQNPLDRIYRTGDRVRYQEDGTIEFIGRIDNQLKIRGFRIEPGEIENAICDHPGIMRASVVARGEMAGDKVLVAYVVGPVEQKNESEIKRHLQERLPDYLIPSRIVVMESLPITENGKINYDALPDPAKEDPASSASNAIRYPNSHAEKCMAVLWAEVLNIKEVPANRDFFDLGGHSLQALKLFNKIEEEFGKKMPLATLFESSTVEALANLVEEKRVLDETPPTLVAIQKNGEGKPFFCIHGGDGGILIYRNLAGLLEPNRPLFGLEAPVLSGAGEVFPTIQETASLYLKQIRTVQPEGPYLLGGYCFGGVIVYEIAQQLRALGEEAELLVLFDTDNPAVAPRYLSLSERAAANWKQNSGVSWAKRVGKLGSRIGEGLVTNLKLRTEKVRVSAAVSSGTTVKGELQTVVIREAHYDAMQHYTPKVYSGDLHLFTAENQGDKVEYPPHLGWDGYIGGNLKLLEIPGEHLTIFDRPNVDVLADKLGRILNQYG